MSDLKPCPFCGTQPVHEKYDPGAPCKQKHYTLGCWNDDCHVDVSVEIKGQISSEPEIRAELERRWNARVQE